VQHRERDQTQLETQEDVHETLAAVLSPAFVEHDVVHGNVASAIVVTDMEQTAPLPLDAQIVAYTTDTIMNDYAMQPVRVTPAQHREV